MTSWVAPVWHGDSDVTARGIAMRLESSQLQRQTHVAIALRSSQVCLLGQNGIARKSWVNKSLGLVCGVGSYDLGIVGLTTQFRG